MRDTRFIVVERDAFGHEFALRVDGEVLFFGAESEARRYVLTREFYKGRGDETRFRSMAVTAAHQEGLL